MSSGRPLGREPIHGPKVQVLAPAKLNLFLHVGERRPDGYHALQSFVAFAGIGDRLEFAPAEDISLTLAGPFAGKIDSSLDNLVLMAASALLSASSAKGGTPGGAAIKLEKNLPVAGGLGGGSADAGATLRALNLMWGLQLGEDELMSIAAGLGSDVPACLLSKPCWMEGRGEHVRATASLPPLPLVLVNPGIGVPTVAVFAALNARSGVTAMKPPSVPLDTVWDLVAYLKESSNDLEAPACQFAPVIDDVLAALEHEPGCILAQMSGSGASCFGLFDGGFEYALGASKRLALEHPDWWVCVTRIASPDAGMPRCGPNS